MRVISGKFGGRNIIAPSSLRVRPTTDFAKTGLFNILTNHFDFENIFVLDLYAGTGNISFEFASRGTEKITCVEADQRCVRFIKEFSNKINLNSMSVIRSDVFAFLKRCENRFDIIFADPPFEYADTDLLPDLVKEKKMLNPDGWLIVEHQSKRELQSKIQPTQIRKYGNCAFSIYSISDENEM
jgi:16S rRNA (guanine966-N2)-methyltransferase